MIDVPTATPVTPPVLPTVAETVLDELQLPPPVELVRLIVSPEHTVPKPEIAAGIVNTVTTVVTELPDTM